MLRRAAALVGSSEAEQRRFVLDNADQDEDFWLTTQQQEQGFGVQDDRSKSVPLPLPTTISSGVEAAAASVDSIPLTRARRTLSTSTESFPTAWPDSLKLEPAFGLLSEQLAAVASSASPDVLASELEEGDLLDIDVTSPAVAAALEGGHSLIRIAQGPGMPMYHCPACGMAGPSLQTTDEACSGCRLCGRCCTTGRAPPSGQTCTAGAGLSARQIRPSVGGVTVVAEWMQAVVDSAEEESFKGGESLGEGGAAMYLTGQSAAWGEVCLALRTPPPLPSVGAYVRLTMDDLTAVRMGLFNGCPGGRLNFQPGSQFQAHFSSVFISIFFFFLMNE